jgi:hypothetical protein
MDIQKFIEKHLLKILLNKEIGMRISDNQIINSLKELKISKLGNVKIGDVFNAKIVEISDGKIIAEVKGKLVLLNNLLGLNLNEGETVELEVTSKEDGKTFAKPTQSEFSKELNIKMIVNELKSLDIETTNKNIKIFNFLKEKNIQFSSAELKEGMNNIKYIEKLINHIDNSDFNLKELDINNDLRKELVKIITANKFSSEKEKINLNKEIMNSDEKVTKENVLDVLKTLVKNQTINEAVKQKTNGDNNLKISEESNLKASEGSNIKASEDQTKKSLVFELKNMELENIMFLVKEKFDINISKLLLAKNFFENGKSISDSLGKIINVIERSENEILIKDVRLLFNKIFNLKTLKLDDFEKLVNEIIDKIGNNNTLGKEEIINIKEEIVFIEKISEFNNELNDKINYFQFTLQENDNLRNAEIFIKKRNSNKRNGKFKIYLSLNTKKNGVVKSIVELEKNNLKIVFIATNMEIKEKLEKDINELKKNINFVNFNNVIINFKVSEKSDNKIEFLLNENSSKIDMRV